MIASTFAAFLAALVTLAPPALADPAVTPTTCPPLGDHGALVALADGRALYLVGERRRLPAPEPPSRETNPRYPERDIGRTRPAHTAPFPILPARMDQGSDDRVVLTHGLDLAPPRDRIPALRTLPTDRAWLFDPAKAKWTPAPRMPYEMRSPAAVRASDGRVVAFEGDQFARQIAFDPRTSRWEELPTQAPHVRIDRTFGDARGAFAYGRPAGGCFYYPVDLRFDPRADVWVSDPGIDAAARSVDPRGRRIVTDGHRLEIDGALVPPTVPGAALGPSVPTSVIVDLSPHHDGVLLASQRAIVWTEAGQIPIASPPSDLSGDAVGFLLDDGTAAVFDVDRVLRFDPIERSWTSITPRRFDARQVVRLADGRILITGDPRRPRCWLAGP